MTDQQDLFAVFDDRPDAGGSGAEPEVTGVPALFLSKLRDRTAEWLGLDVQPGDVFVGYVEDRIWVAIDLVDEKEEVDYACVRVDVSSKEWKAAWVSPSLGDARQFEYASPRAPIAGSVLTDAEHDTDQAIDWLRAQLKCTVKRYVWEEDGEAVAELWRVEETGESLIASGDPAYRQDLSTATHVSRVR
jgi:hypothetical protein